MNKKIQFQLPAEIGEILTDLIAVKKASAFTATKTAIVCEALTLLHKKLCKKGVKRD